MSLWRHDETTGELGGLVWCDGVITRERDFKTGGGRGEIT